MNIIEILKPRIGCIKMTDLQGHREKLQGLAVKPLCPNEVSQFLSFQVTVFVVFWVFCRGMAGMKGVEKPYNLLKVNR